MVDINIGKLNEKKGEQMEIKGKKFIVLYLTDWQKRMTKDFLGTDCNYIQVPIDKGPPVLLYGVRFPTTPEVKRMYLTDWQIREMKDEAGISCDFIELKKDPHIVKYGAPPV
ncbi:MAG: hypothetical protein O8C62_00140 [Candidatus Methanoperedens sp.]|nr:hypothetical protein [Candidatus Methanoperedens sp.]